MPNHHPFSGYIYICVCYILMGAYKVDLKVKPAKPTYATQKNIWVEVLVVKLFIYL